ncbi:DNA mismatch repair protein MutL [Actinoplanes sp. TFC3]|uniref:DNA mismatch repair protein MutL n=1 Tax=Actinoplanes sp. TFC3 TaxID=1710355 RepID=UPI000831122B|nr:DNA mismatch repair protein MutL [Actinoplanes sp. TFC3]
MRSTRSWFPLLGWCAATLTSVALASVAMLPVLRTATANEGTLVSVDQIRDTDEITPAPQPTVTTGSPTKAPTTSPSPSGKTRVPGGTKPSSPPGKASSPPPGENPPGENPSGGKSPGDKSPTGKPSATKPPTVEDGWTVTTDGDGVRTYVRSFRVKGGQTVIRASKGVIKLVTATPSGGYSVATVQNSPDNLAVYFNETNHSFIVHVVWQTDKPFVQVSEVGS